MKKSIDLINERVRDGNARVVTADEMPGIVAELERKRRSAKWMLLPPGPSVRCVHQALFLISAMQNRPSGWSGYG